MGPSALPALLVGRRSVVPYQGHKDLGKGKYRNTDITLLSCQNAVANQALNPSRSYPRFPLTHSGPIYSDSFNKCIQFA